MLGRSALRNPRRIGRPDPRRPDHVRSHVAGHDGALAPADPGPYRMTVDEFERIADSLDRRVELVDGTLMERPEMSTAHVLLIARLRSRLEPMVLPIGWHVREEKAIRIPDRNVRLPDIAIVRGRFEDYPTQHPLPKDAALLVEVAMNSLGRDQGLKRELYGSRGVPAYWIVNVKARQIEAYSGPAPPGYSACARTSRAIPCPWWSTASMSGRSPSTICWCRPIRRPAATTKGARDGDAHRPIHGLPRGGPRRGRGEIGASFHARHDRPGR